MLLSLKGNGGFSIYLADEQYFYDNLAIINLWKTSKRDGEVSALRITDIQVNDEFGVKYTALKKMLLAGSVMQKSLDGRQPNLKFVCMQSKIKM